MRRPTACALAHNIPRRTLELAFAAFLASVSIRFLIDLLWLSASGGLGRGHRAGAIVRPPRQNAQVLAEPCAPMNHT